MRLIRKSRTQGYFAERSRTGHHQIAGFLQASLDHVGVRRFAKCQLERSREVSRATPRNRAQIPGMNRAMQILVDKGPHPSDLPTRKPCRSRLSCARMAFNLGLQDSRSSGKRRLRRFAIVLQLTPHHLEELCQAACQVAECQV